MPSLPAPGQTLGLVETSLCVRSASASRCAGWKGMGVGHRHFLHCAFLHVPPIVLLTGWGDPEMLRRS